MQTKQDCQNLICLTPRSPGGSILSRRLSNISLVKGLFFSHTLKFEFWLSHEPGFVCISFRTLLTLISTKNQHADSFRQCFGREGDAFSPHQEIKTYKNPNVAKLSYLNIELVRKFMIIFP